MRRLLSILLAAFAAGCASDHRRAETSDVMETFATGRPDYLISRETRRELERGGGVEVLTDGKLSSLSVVHHNQRALGGGSALLGSGAFNTSTNTGDVLKRGGEGLGSIAQAIIEGIK